MKTAFSLILTAALAAVTATATALFLADGSTGAIVACAASAGVTWVVMAALIVRTRRTASVNEKDLRAQLARREIELGRTSTVDELTGLATRREFDAMLRLEVGRYQRHRHSTTLLLVELDGIGELHEALGPITHNLAIAELAGILKESLRAIDLGCRFTERTLAVLLLETSAEQAAIVTDRIHQAVAEHTFVAQRSDGKLQLAVAQGVATLDETMTSHLDFVRTAEQALATARSQVTVLPAVA